MRPFSRKHVRRTTDHRHRTTVQRPSFATSFHPSIYGNKQVRDWLYVEDNCRAIDLILQKGQPGEVYNIGGNCEKKNIDVVRAICSILEEKLKADPSRITHHPSPPVSSPVTH